MAIFIFQRFFKQDELNVFDISFFFGLFFLGLIFGKCIYLIYLLTYFTIDNISSLFLLKFRYIFIILTAAPLISLGIKLVMTNKENEDDYDYKLNFMIVLLFIIMTTCLVIIAPNYILLNIILAVIHISSLTWICLTFIYAYRKKRSFGINLLIVAIILLIDLILYIFSIATSPIRKETIGFSPLYIIFAELVDLLIIIVIFFGYIKKPK
jgi:hypothetical protein